MRVLFLPIPGVGHSFPAVPLAWALRAAGHEVLFGTSADGLAVDRAGLPVVDLRLGADNPEVFAAAYERHPDTTAKIIGDGGIGLADLTEAVPLFGDVAAHFTGPVLQLARAWRPDVVVHTALHGVALVAAAALGVPAVALGDGFGRAAPVAPAMHRHLAATFAAAGVTALPPLATIDTAPPSMVDGGSEGWPMRYVPYNGGAVLPDWLPPLGPAPARPRICVTLGSVRPRTSGFDRVEPLLAAAERVDAEFVLALGDVDTDALGPLPDNVRTVGWIPLSMLLPGCAALVHHGGGGSTFTALAAGVPQLVLPGGGDSTINADAVVSGGAGLQASPEEVDAVLLEQLIGDDKLRAGAAAVRDEIAAMPAPDRIVTRLADLVAGR